MAHVCETSPQLSALPHLLSWEKVAEDLLANLERGFSAQEAEQRLQKYGLNELKGYGAVPIWKVLLKQVCLFSI